MKIKYLYILLSLLSFVTFSCKENANDWEYDESYNRLFRPVTFKVNDFGSTYAELSYTGVTNATKYVFEFSEGDSLLFNNITRVDTIVADTLTPYVEASSITKTEFHTLFKNLNGTTRYSVRIKAIDEKSGMESGYVGICFDTPDEQIFTNNAPGVNSATLSWVPESEVTNIKYGEISEPSDTIWLNSKVLTDAEKKAGRAVIDGLNPGTNYLATILKGNAKRGTVNFKTLGMKSGVTIQVQPGDNINDLLAQQAAQGVTNISFVFKGGQTYEIETITVPVGISNIYFVGDVKMDETLPNLYLHHVNLSSPLSNISFQYIDLDARSNSSNFVFSIADDNCFKSISFDGCTIRNISRSLVYLNRDNLDIESIKISNCIIKNVGAGGYGLLNLSKSTVKLKSIAITNTTMMDMGDQLMQMKSSVSDITMNKCIFCNFNIGIGKIFRFDAKPTTITVTNSIFTGNNNGVKVNSGNGDYSSYLSFTSCYLTSDFVVDTRKFTNAETLSLKSEDLFVDPRNGDFHIKEGVKFAGAGKVGDPRWWN